MVTLASGSEEAQRASLETKEFSGSFALRLNPGSLNHKARGKSLWGQKRQIYHSTKQISVFPELEEREMTTNDPTGVLGRWKYSQIDFGDCCAVL